MLMFLIRFLMWYYNYVAADLVIGRGEGSNVKLRMFLFANIK